MSINLSKEWRWLIHKDMLHAFHGLGKVKERKSTAYRLPNAADTGKLEFKPVVLQLRF